MGRVSVFAKLALAHLGKDKPYQWSKTAGEGSEVSFYRVINKDSDDVLKNNLSGAVQDKLPVYKNKDIIEYSQSEHTIKLTKEAYKKFRALNGFSPFVICVDNQPVYFGTVWKGYMVVTGNGLSDTPSISECDEIQFEYSYVSIPISIDGVPLNRVIDK